MAIHSIWHSIHLRLALPFSVLFSMILWQCCLHSSTKLDAPATFCKCLYYLVPMYSILLAFNCILVQFEKHSFWKTHTSPPSQKQFSWCTKGYDTMQTIHAYLFHTTKTASGIQMKTLVLSDQN